MRIISAQYSVNIPIMLSHIGDKEHKIGINLISPDVGVCVDGHHGYVASMIDHKPIRIVILPLKFSDDLTSGALLDHWMSLSDKQVVKALEGSEEQEQPTNVKWSFYDLMTGYGIEERILRKIVDQFPDYNYNT